MSQPAPQPRRYDEDEVREVLERATELQHGTAPAAPEASGLTLAQLEDIAVEAGIDPAAIRRAAHELDTNARSSDPAGLAPRLAGAPIGLVLERVVPAEVAPDNLHELVPRIQAASDAPGQANLVGQTLSWHARSGSNLQQLQVTVTSRGGETRIQVEERYGGLAGSVFGSGVGGIGAGVGFGVGIGVGASIGSALMMVGFPIAVLGLTYMGSRAVYRTIVGGREETLVRLADALEHEVAAMAGGDPPTLPAPVPEAEG